MLISLRFIRFYFSKIQSAVSYISNTIFFCFQSPQSKSWRNSAYFFIKNQPQFPIHYLNSVVYIVSFSQRKIPRYRGSRAINLNFIYGFNVYGNSYINQVEEFVFLSILQHSTRIHRHTILLPSSLGLLQTLHRGIASARKILDGMTWKYAGIYKYSTLCLPTAVF